MHVIAGKAVCFGEALQPEFRQLRPVRDRQCPGAGRVLAAGGLTLISGGTDNHLLLVDVTPLGIGGRLAEKVLECLRHHGQQEHDPVRRAKADGPLGNSHRHAGPHHARHGSCGDETDRRMDVGVLRQPDDAQVAAAVQQEVLDMCQHFPVPASATREHSVT